jgi:EamA-like transporter family.
VFSRRGSILFLVSVVLFGGTFVAAKAGLAHFPPLLFVAVRFDIGAIVLAIYAMSRFSWAELRPRTPGDILGILATGGLVIGLTNALLFVGQQYVTSGVAAVVFSLNPILTPVFVAILLSEGSAVVACRRGDGAGIAWGGSGRESRPGCVPECRPGDPYSVRWRRDECPWGRHDPPVQRTAV